MKRRDFLWAASGSAAVSASTGAAGAATSSSAGPAAQESGTTTNAPNGTTSPNGSMTTTAGAAPSGETHVVDMAADAFEPSSITLAPGDTVRWTNGSSVGHTVTGYEDEIPEGGSYFASGGWDSEEAARNNYESGNEDSGFIPPGGEYTHTFETTGTYGYFCIPHEALDMVGTVEVVEGGGGGGDGGHGPQSPHEMGVPFQPHFVGLATLLMTFVSLVFTFFVVKYGASPHASSPNRRD